MDGSADGRCRADGASACGILSFFWGGVLSAVPKGTQANQVWDYVPGWEIDEFDSPNYRFQTPLTQLEILCYDGYSWVIICKPEMSPKIRAAIPQAKAPDDFYKTKE